MKRGKILTLLVVTSLGAATLTTLNPPQTTYAQTMSKTLDSNSNNDNNGNNIDEKSGEESFSTQQEDPSRGNSESNSSIKSKSPATSDNEKSQDSKLQDKNSNEKSAIKSSEENSNSETLNSSTEEGSSIDTSEFNNQVNFEGEDDGHNVVQKSGENKVTTRVSENYYNFNIPGAQKYTYGTSGNGRSLYYYKIGTGKKVLFMNFGIHGYEDAWSRDGEELTKLAKNLTEKIAADNASNGLNGWSVVIVPSANPDGVLDGWTNNGPGRNQVSKKIDLNRSFPTFFTPQYGARNYTGPTPLAAPEAKALASLVDKLSAESSHMALVDVHGWLNETIGDPSLGKAFDSNFAISNKLMSKAANGYLISYAHSKGALASLLELPMPSNSSSIQNNGYANKLYNSVKSIIKNGDGFQSMNAEGQVYNTNSLNIRITTSTNSNIIGTYSSGTKIKILGRVGDWYQVKSSSGYGFVHKDYVKILSNNNGNNNGSAEEAPTKYQIGKVANLSTSLNIRKSPSTSASVIGSLSKGTEVKVVSTEGEWYKVYSPSFGYGYAHKNYIEIVENNNNEGNDSNKPVPPVDEQVTQSGTIVNISTSLNVRASASTSGKIIGSLKNGSKVNIITKEGSWYKIQDSSFGTGYISAQYVKVNSNNTPVEPDKPEPDIPDNSTSNKTGQVVNISTKLNIRSGAGTNFRVVGSLAPNVTVNILGQEGKWYKISYNGTVGYVSAEYIKVNNNGGNNNNDNQGTSEKYGKVINISSKLNIRKTPSTSASIVGTLSNNTKVTILEKTNGWYKISYNGTIGYVSASYIAEL